VKSVVRSLVDDDGNPTIERTWNVTFIDPPDLGKQKQPVVTAEDVDRCIKDSKTDQEELLCAIAAGPAKRIGEILAITVGCADTQTRWIEADSEICVAFSVYQGKGQKRLKTAAAARTFDLDLRLSSQIAKYISKYSIQVGAPLFQTHKGTRLHEKTARDRLAKHHVEGFHGFRRFHTTRLRENGTAEDIIRFRVGHAGNSITSTSSATMATACFPAPQAFSASAPRAANSRPPGATPTMSIRNSAPPIPPTTSSPPNRLLRFCPSSFRAQRGISLLSPGHTAPLFVGAGYPAGGSRRTISD
jgi:Phage integrase family